MATCADQVGVKNILITFRDCDSGRQVGPYSHKLSGDDLPMIKTCPYSNEIMTQGYVKRKVSQQEIEMKVIRDLRIPLSYYQGCAASDIQIEMFNGLVYSAVNGTSTGDEKSDTHEVTLTMTFRKIDELLPAGALAA